jgi:hypothetical protein
MKTQNLVLTILGLFMFVVVHGQNVPKPNTPGQNNLVKKEATCESGDCMNGWGKKVYDYGYYEGFFQNGNRHGYGLFNWTESGDYIGFWANDKMHGYGCYLGTGKDLIGQYVNGSLHGFGHTKEIKTDKWVYGYFQTYLVEDEYTFYDNGVTTGCIAGDCQNKYGRYKWSNGDTFTGFFQNGKMFMGNYKFATGDKYEGMFNSNNQFHGQGRFFFKDGGYYGGDWENGERAGRGYYHDKSYARQIGEWRNGNLTKSLN